MKEVNATQFKNDYEYRKALQDFKKGERNKRNQRGSKWNDDNKSKNVEFEMNTFMGY